MVALLRGTPSKRAPVRIRSIREGCEALPSGKKRKRQKIATHKRKKRRRRDRHKKK